MADQKLTKLANDLAPLLRRKLSTTTISGGTGAGGGVVDHGQLTGLADNDHPQYLLRSGAVPMSGDLDMAGYSIDNIGLIDGFDINGFGGLLSELEMHVTALQSRTVYGGDGVDSDEVLFGAGSPTLSVNVSDFAGAGLMDDGSNNLTVRVGDGLELDGLYVAVDEAFDFDWTGDHTHTGVSSSVDFDAGDPIVGAKIDWGTGLAWFAGIEATSLTIKTFVSDVTLALQGSEIIAKSKAIVSRDFSTPATTGTLYVYDLPGQPDTAVFEVGDFVRLRYVNRATGLSVGDVWGTVSAYNDEDDGEQSWTFTRTAGDAGQTIYSGMVALDYGQSGDGYIELSSLGDDTPVIRLRTWETDPSAGGNHTTRAILGNLSGHTDSTYGALDGYGFFTEIGYLKGRFGASDGNVFVDNSAVTILAGDTASSLELANSLSFSSDPESPSLNNTIGFVQGDLYESGGIVIATTNVGTRYGTINSVDRGTAEFGVRNPSSATEFGSLIFTGENGVVRADMVVQNDDGSEGEFELHANVTLEGHWFPLSDIQYDIGSPSKRVRRLYADEVVAGTSSSIDTGHSHGEFLTEAEITVLLAAKSNIKHSHDGYVTSVSLATTLADYISDSDLSTALADYYDSATVDGLLSAKASAVHSHNLADLEERNYSSLTSRGHALASTSGLGPDHTVSGLTAGMVLRATGADAAQFAVLDYADLGTTEHDIDSEHSGSLPWARVAKSGSDLADLEARAYASLTGRTHNVVSEHSITAAQYSVLGTWSGANTLSMETASENGTTAHTLLMSGDNGELSLQTIYGYNGVLYVGDTMRSPNYLPSGGRIGWELAEGTQKLSNAFISGALSSAVIEYKSRIVGGGGQIWRPAGRLKTAATITGRVNLEVAPPSFPTVTLHLENPEAGKIQIADVDDVLMVQAIAYESPPTTTSSANPGYIFPFIGSYAYADAQPVSRLTRFVVTDVTDEGDYYSYDCIVVHATGSNYAYPAGTGVVVDGNGIEVVADEPYSPRLAVYKLNQEFYDDDNTHQYYHDDIVVLGRLDSKSFANAGEVGLAVHSPGGWGYGLESWIVASDDRVALNNTTITMTPWSSENNQLVIDPVRGISFYVDSDELEQFESETYPDADVFMALDWVDPNDDNRQLMRIDADTDGQRVIEANHTKRSWYDDYYQETNYERKSRLLVSSNSQDSDHFSAALANKSATLELEASHLYIVPDDEDGETTATTASTATLTADWVGLRQNATATINGKVWNSKFTLRDGLIFLDAPTTSTGLPVGALWCDNGTYKRVMS